MDGAERTANARASAGRMWLWYSIAWIPLVLFDAVLMSFPRSALPPERPVPLVALFEGVAYVVPVALLGACVWWLTGRLVRRSRSSAALVALHLIGAAAFSFMWLGSQVAFIAYYLGLARAMQMAWSFAGFQLIVGGFVYGLLAAGSHAIRISWRMQEQEARLVRADALRMRAELAALRGQLNPHFLFNTLHTLTALLRREPASAERALERFGDMLRYVLDVNRLQREDVTLADELAFVRDYLSLEQLRLGHRLSVIERIEPEALECILPSLTLQPLVENAIRHGIASRASGGTVEIVATCSGDVLELEVRDDGPGTRSDVVDSAAGVGLRAVRQRLDTRYERGGAFRVFTAPGEGFVACVRLPAHTVSGLSDAEAMATS